MTSTSTSAAGPSSGSPGPGPPNRAGRGASAPEGRPARGLNRTHSPAYVMIPLTIFLLGCAGVYLGSIEAAFSALMRLSLRLVAERTGRPDALGDYLDDPMLLFVPVRLLLGFVTAGATVLLAQAIGIDGAHTVTFVVLCVAAFVVICQLLLPLAIVRRDPERVLEYLLPTFKPFARALAPVTRFAARAISSTKRNGAPGTADEAAEEANEV